MPYRMGAVGEQTRVFRGSRARVIASVALLGIAAAGCVGSSASVANKPDGTTAGGGGAPPPAADAVLTITPDNGGTGVAPGNPIVVRVANGKLTDVTIHGPAGPSVAGKFRAGKKWWRSTPGAAHVHQLHRPRFGDERGRASAAGDQPASSTLKPEDRGDGTIFEGARRDLRRGHADHPQLRPAGHAQARRSSGRSQITHARSRSSARGTGTATSTLYFRPRRYWPRTPRSRSPGTWTA